MRNDSEGHSTVGVEARLLDMPLPKFDVSNAVQPPTIQHEIRSIKPAKTTRLVADRLCGPVIWKPTAFIASS